MKLLAVTLVLATLTGTQASILSEDLEQAKSYLEGYLRSVSRIIDEEDDLFEESNVIRMISDYTEERFSNVSRHFQKLKAELVEAMPREVKEALLQPLSIPVYVAEKASEVASEFIRRMTQPTEELYAALRPVVAPHAKPILQELRTLAGALLSELQEEDKEGDEWVRSKLKWLDADLGPTVKEVLRRLQEFQAALRPYVDTVEEELKKDVRCAGETLKPYVLQILQELQDSAQAIRKWARSL